MNIKGTRSNPLALSQDERELSQLMRESQNGNGESYNRLLTRIAQMLLGYVRKSVRSDMVDDVLQEIVMGVHLKRHTFNSEQYFLPWLYAIARYKVVDYLRRKGREEKRFMSREDLDLLAVSDAELTIESMSVENIEEIISDLPTKQLQVLTAVKIKGLSIKEASEQLGFSESDIKVTIYRAMKSLKIKFENGRKS
jgi:RNA polymerase sigma-70 factor, ECF subfamily